MKFSTKSSSRVGSQSPRIITSNDTRRGSSSRSIRFHSVNRSQSAVSEPTRLSLPLDAIIKRVVPEQRRDSVLQMFVACQILIKRLPSRHARLLEFDDDEAAGHSQNRSDQAGKYKDRP